MDLSNILSVTVSTVGQLSNDVSLNWLGNIIKALIEGCGSIGLGIIVFTLILKAITLPFDIISRVSTKKNTIRMEKIRPELEKLQRQYANNSELYQRKMQALYKENNYSPFATCLPTLLNLVFFVVVIGQFSNYSNYANYQVFCDMSASYEQAVVTYAQQNSDKIYVYTNDGEDNSKPQYYINLYTLAQNEQTLKDYNLSVDKNNEYNARFTMDVTSENIKKLYDEIAKGQEGLLSAYTVGEEGQIIENGGVYSFNLDKCGVDENGEKYTEKAVMTKFCTELVEACAAKTVKFEVQQVARTAALENYKTHDLSFLWVKNIWSQDLPWQHPIKGSFAEYNFVKDAGCVASCKSSCGGVNNKITGMTDEQYNELTAALTEEKSQPNGYLILVVLSIGTMLLQQVVMNKMSKSQMELSTVEGENGTAAQSQKMMTWMMPLMFGIFSFMYTASFSIYIVVNSLFSLASTLIINWIVEKRFEKLAEQEAKEIELKRTGRIKELNELKNNKKKKK